MRNRILLAAAATLFALWMSACADDKAGFDDDGSGNSGSGNSGAASSSGTSSGTNTSTSSGTGGSAQGGDSPGGSGTGGSVKLPPFCMPACNTTADCNLGSAPYDADNYSCDEDYCEYTGCNSDAECKTLGNQTCHDTAGFSTCLLACGKAADCDIGGGVAYDADNYSCEQGACLYTGCNSDAECQSLGKYVCHDFSGTSFCALTCITASDCDYGGGAAYDADNYSCDSGVCVYTGCNSDAECKSLGNYVCR